MKRNKLVILPKLCDCSGDPRKQWHIFFSARDPRSGKMKRFRIYDGFTELRTKKDKYAHAETLITSYSAKLKAGWDPFAEDTVAIYDDQLQYANTAKWYGSKRQSNKTFAYYTSLFMPELKGLRPVTYRNYLSKYRHFNLFLEKNGMAGNDVSTITEEAIHQFFLFLINDMKLARITVSKYQHTIERIFAWMAERKHIRESPVKSVPTTTRENDTAPRPVNDADIEALVEEIKKDRQLWLTVQLEYYCFMRPGLEIRLARVKWFDLARGRIIIPKDLVKTNMDKVVIIPSQFRDVLVNDYKLHLFPHDYYIIGPNGLPGDRPIGSNNLRNRFNIIRDRLKLPKEYKLYSWKHTGNVRAEDAGIPMAARQRQNGHRSMHSTEEYLKNKIGFKSNELENQFPTL